MKLNTIAANQNEIVTTDGRTVFFSYNTPVAVFIPGRGAVCTKTKYSRTTSKHVAQAVERWGATRINVPQAEFDNLAKI